MLAAFIEGGFGARRVGIGTLSFGMTWQLTLSTASRSERRMSIICLSMNRSLGSQTALSTVIRNRRSSRRQKTMCTAVLTGTIREIKSLI